MLELDALAGLPDGYSSKLLSEPRAKYNYQRNIGPEAMGKLLTALGYVIRLEHGFVSPSENQTYPHLSFMERAIEAWWPRQLREDVEN